MLDFRGGTFPQPKKLMHLLFYLLLSCPSCNALATSRFATQRWGLSRWGSCGDHPLNVEPPKIDELGRCFCFSSWWFFTTHLKNMLVKCSKPPSFPFGGAFFSFKMGLEDQSPFRMANFFRGRTEKHFRGVHPRKLTKIPKMMVCKRWLLSNMAICGLYVKLQGCYPFFEMIAIF